MSHPRNLEEWFREAEKLPGQDYDCIVLFTGEERSGKSETAIQMWTEIGRRTQKPFDVKNIAFGIPSFFRIVSGLEKGGIVHLDEAPVNARKAMNRDIIKLLDYLQVSGGLNHFTGLCYPRAWRADGMIIERVRYNVHKVNRSQALMRVPSGEDENPWKVLFSFTTGPAPDSIRDPYLMVKEAAARERALELLPKAPEDPNNVLRELSLLKRTDP